MNFSLTECLIYVCLAAVLTYFATYTIMRKEFAKEAILHGAAEYKADPQTGATVLMWVR